MSYSEYGLDTVKKSQDDGQKSATFFDPWLSQLVTGRNFYLCFSNWVLSQATITAFLKQEPVEPLPDDCCFKCRAKNTRLHYWIDYKVEERGMDLGICADCIKWASEYVEKEIPVAPGTQFGLLGDSQPKQRKKTKKTPHASKSTVAPPEAPSPTQLILNL